LFDLPSIPDPLYNFSLGIADNLSFGIGPLLRSEYGISGPNRCSKAYKYGGYASFLAGSGRLLYAGGAKLLPYLIRSGETELANALEVSAARNTLKLYGRAGTFPNYKMYTADQILLKYGADPDAIIDAATRTSPFWNALGADAALGGDANAASSGCGCQ
jgi:hypothetical protein